MTPVFGRNSKLAPDLNYIPFGQTAHLIVKYRSDVRHARNERIQSLRVKASLSLLNAEAVSVLGSELPFLADDPDIEFIWPDREVRASAYNSSPDYGWITVGAAVASERDGLTGRGISVAVLDSGIDHQEDLQSSSGPDRVVYDANFVTPDSETTQDLWGHGTHVAGIIGGSGRLSSGLGAQYTVRGIAPEVQLLNLRVLDRNGVGSDSFVIMAIEHAIRLKDRYNIRVLNLSLGRPVFESYRTDPLCQAVQRAWESGIVVVVAAGNEGRNNDFGTSGYGLVTAPGNSPYVITVGAMNTMSSASIDDDNERNENQYQEGTHRAV